MFSTFTAIFEALDDIEKELSGGKTEDEKEELVNTLLSLRKTMDKCVQYWLRFEERMNEIQERYGLSLPDTLPEGFMEKAEFWEEMLAGEKPLKKRRGVKKRRGRAGPDKKRGGRYLFSPGAWLLGTGHAERSRGGI